MSKEYLSAKYNADLLTVDYAAGDGSHLLRSGGTIAWRFNNPGNLRPARRGKPIYGAIGVGKTKSNGEFLIFSSYHEGRVQKKALLRRKYNERTLHSMLAGVDDGAGNLTGGYAPASDNNDPKKYAEAISSHTGLPITQKLSSLTDAQLDSVLDAMEQHEGFHARRETRKEKIVNTTSIVLSDGARPKPDIPIKVTIGKQEHLTKTDHTGQIPAIVHLNLGETVDIFTTSLEGKWHKIHSFVIDGQSRTLALLQEMSLFSASSEIKKPATVPPKAVRAPIRYIVQSGDTLGKIALRFKTTTLAIKHDNPHIKDAAKIYPSQVISIYGPISSISPTIATTKSPPLQQTAKPKSTALPAEQGKQAAKPAIIVRSKAGQGAPLALLPFGQKRAPWMVNAVVEAKRWAGKTEATITKQNNYHKMIGSGFLTSLVGSDNAWCASFVNYCLENAGYRKWKNPFRARAVALDANFVEVKKPVFGAIALVGTHHVALVYAKNGANYVCLGGNQSDQINFSLFRKELRFFVPLTYHEHAVKEITRGDSLAEHTIDELNSEFGIKLKLKKGNATR